jgi:hypothetical protein
MTNLEPEGENFAQEGTEGTFGIAINNGVCQ